MAAPSPLLHRVPLPLNFSIFTSSICQFSFQTQQSILHLLCPHVRRRHSVVEEVPAELPSSIPSVITAANDSNALQTAATVRPTGFFTLFLFRSLRIRAKLAKAMCMWDQKFGSSYGKNSLKRETLEILNKESKSPVKAKSPPSPDQALLGALIASVFGVLLYKFTTTIEFR